MDKQSMYTAQEMRDAAEYMSDSIRDIRDGNDSLWPKDSDTPKDWEAMLRQAADTEEELAKVKASKERWTQYQETAAGERNACIDELRKKDAEIAQLKAQLAAVQKSLDEHQDCHKCKSYPHCDGSGCICAVVEITNILRAARGEGSVSRQA